MIGHGISVSYIIICPQTSSFRQNIAKKVSKQNKNFKQPKKGRVLFFTFIKRSTEYPD